MCLIATVTNNSWDLAATTPPKFLAAFQGPIHGHLIGRPGFKGCNPCRACLHRQWSRRKATAFACRYSADRPGESCAFNHKTDDMWTISCVAMDTSQCWGSACAPSLTIFVPLQETQASVGPTILCQGAWDCNGSVSRSLMFFVSKFWADVKQRKSKALTIFRPIYLCSSASKYSCRKTSLLRNMVDAWLLNATQVVVLSVTWTTGSRLSRRFARGVFIWNCHCHEFQFAALWGSKSASRHGRKQAKTSVRGPAEEPLLALHNCYRLVMPCWILLIYDYVRLIYSVCLFQQIRINWMDRWTVRNQMHPQYQGPMDTSSICILLHPLTAFQSVCHCSSYHIVPKRPRWLSRRQTIRLTGSIRMIRICWISLICPTCKYTDAIEILDFSNFLRVKLL